MAFTTALYNLVARPDLVATLKEEVEPILEEDGWTKNAMSKMRKLDSFLKESLRLYGTNAGKRSPSGLKLVLKRTVNTDRKVLKDFTFTNGTKLPA